MSTRLDGWTISLPSPLPIRGHNWDDLAGVHIVKLGNNLVTSPCFASLDLTRAGSARSVWNVRENTQTEKNGGKTMDVGYVGLRIEGPGTVQVCLSCADSNKYLELGGHSFAPVYSTDTYITNNGGMRCDSCREVFI
jgi:hypothetical protein